MYFNLQGDTPLHLVSLNGYRQVVELLLEGGADPNYSADNVSSKYIQSYYKVMLT